MTSWPATASTQACPLSGSMSTERHRRAQDWEASRRRSWSDRSVVAKISKSSDEFLGLFGGVAFRRALLEWGWNAALLFYQLSDLPWRIDGIEDTQRFPVQVVGQWQAEKTEGGGHDIDQPSVLDGSALSYRWAVRDNDPVFSVRTRQGLITEVEVALVFEHRCVQESRPSAPPVGVVGPLDHQVRRHRQLWSGVDFLTSVNPLDKRAAVLGVRKSLERVRDLRSCLLVLGFDLDDPLRFPTLKVEIQISARSERIRPRPAPVDGRVVDGGLKLALHSSEQAAVGLGAKKRTQAWWNDPAVCPGKIAETTRPDLGETGECTGGVMQEALLRKPTIEIDQPAQRSSTMIRNHEDCRVKSLVGDRLRDQPADRRVKTLVDITNDVTVRPFLRSGSGCLAMPKAVLSLVGGHEDHSEEIPCLALHKT